ncbi:MAG: PQQ-like beta-propeller repeat protein [Bacteroidales bacterium]|jgi:outer membrane protein assembly factor BamB|nr:PQQ-like beta-propeller repeat protein [Bacteroidales bacterium]
MKKVSLAITIIIFLGLTPGCKNEIAQWRGPDRNGIFQEIDLLDQWPEDGPELLWIYEGLGRGYASPAVTKDMIFVNGEQDGKSYLFALDMDGKISWKSPNGDAFLGEGFSSTYPGARSTPTVFNNLVYTSGGEGRIACFETSSGEEKWAVNITDLGGEVGYFGYSESLAVDEKHLYCFPGGSETNMAALDRFSGELAWASEVLKDTFAYGSPVLVDMDDREVLITTSRHNIFTLDRRNGELLGSYKLEGYEYDGEHCNSVVYEDGFVYFVANDTKGQGALKLKLENGGNRLTEVWRNPEIMNNFGGFVIVDDHLFTTLKGNQLVSLDAESGSITDSLKVGTGSIIYSDNKFFCYSYIGAVYLISYNEGDMEISSKFRVKGGSGQHFSHPVLSDKMMYIRRGNSLMAYRVK